MNLLLVMLISLAFQFGLLANDTEHLASVSLGFLLQLQISAILLNLLPVPPLDGFQALAPWLPETERQRFSAMSNYALWIVFLALWFVEPLNHLFWDSVYSISSALGVSPRLGYVGWKAFRFWDHSAF